MWHGRGEESVDAGEEFPPAGGKVRLTFAWYPSARGWDPVRRNGSGGRRFHRLRDAAAQGCAPAEPGRRGLPGPAPRRPTRSPDGSASRTGPARAGSRPFGRLPVTRSGRSSTSLRERRRQVAVGRPARLPEPDGAFRPGHRDPRRISRPRTTTPRPRRSAGNRSGTSRSLPALAPAHPDTAADGRQAPRGREYFELSPPSRPAPGNGIGPPSASSPAVDRAGSRPTRPGRSCRPPGSRRICPGLWWAHQDSNLGPAD